MARKISVKTPIPTEPDHWLAEIAMAYKTAQMFMETGMEPPPGFEKAEPWQLAPLFCLSARGIRQTPDLFEQAAGMAFENFLENYTEDEAAALAPVLSFAFCYMGAHLGLGLVDEDEANRILDLAEDNVEHLNMMVEKVSEILQQENPFALAMQTLAEGPGSGKKGRKAKKGVSKGSAANAGKIYLIEITLMESSPRIWRLVAVPGDYSLGQVHDVVQAVFNWTDTHLHEFEIGKQTYGRYSEDEDEFGADEDFEDEAEFRLCDLIARKGKKFIYTYDFGDNWDHELVVRDIVMPEEGVAYPACLAGERAAPLEDRGGIWGYEAKLEALKNPEHKDHEDIVEWMGADFDPEAFDLSAINERLH
jgi:hypothetical protein